MHHSPGDSSVEESKGSEFSCRLHFSRNGNLNRLLGDFIVVEMSSTVRKNLRYDPIDRPQIPGFPNPMPYFDWFTHLPIFRDENKYDVDLNLINFHVHVCRLRVEFIEDCLMKVFLATLEDKSRVWYEGLLEGSLCSLKYFHKMFSKHYVKSNLSLSLLQSCCDYSEGFIAYLESIDDIECMNDEEIIEAFYDSSL